jgi:thioredoxin 1
MNRQIKCFFFFLILIISCSGNRKIAGKSYIVSQSSDQKILIGKITPEQLWEELPTWKENFDDYEPKAGAVNILRSTQYHFDIICIFGSWCVDSQFGIPGFLKALDLAQNPHLNFELFAVDRNKKDPEQIAQKLNINRIPTFIIYFQGLETHRIVEYPVKTFEEDLADFIEIFSQNF